MFSKAFGSPCAVVRRFVCGGYVFFVRNRVLICGRPTAASAGSKTASAGSKNVSLVMLCGSAHNRVAKRNALFSEPRSDFFFWGKISAALVNKIHQTSASLAAQRAIFWQACCSMALLLKNIWYDDHQYRWSAAQRCLATFFLYI